MLKILYHYLVGSHTKDYWCDLSPVFETDLIKVYWDQPVLVVGHCPSDRPDIVLWTKSDKCTYLIDVSISIVTATSTLNFVKRLQSTVTWQC